MFKGAVSVDMFFDDGGFSQKVAAKERRVLKKSGAYGRKVMRNMIRRRKKKSLPGNAPHAHVTGNAALKLVLFGYDPAAGSVRIGHLYEGTGSSAFGRRKAIRRIIKPLGGKTSLQMLNEGGTAKVRIRKKYGDKKFKTQIWHFRARPFRDLSFPIVNRFYRKQLAENPFY